VPAVAAETVHISTPLGKHATDLYRQFVESDHAEMDFSAIIQLLQAPKK